MLSSMVSSGSARCFRAVGKHAPSRPSGSRAVLVRCCSGAHHDHNHDHSFRLLSRRQLVAGGAAGLLVGSSLASADPANAEQVARSDEEWKRLLTPAQYRVLRQQGTERPGSSPLNKEKRQGTFVCAGCSSPLFPSATKYESGTGWPSFFEPLPGAVEEKSDFSIPWMPRTEVECSTCGGHLGHVFDDGPPPTRLRYCMNGVAMKFVPAEGASTA